MHLPFIDENSVNIHPLSSMSPFLFLLYYLLLRLKSYKSPINLRYHKYFCALS